MQMSVHKNSLLQSPHFIAHLHHLSCHSPGALGNRRVTETSSSSTAADHPSQSQTFFWIDFQGEEGRDARLPKMHLLLFFF